jgi:hypothetical protein
MTPEEQAFLRELEIFRGECEGSSQHLYAYLTIHGVAKRRKTVFRALDRHALFWNTVAGALQGSAIITLGRACVSRNTEVAALLAVVRCKRVATVPRAVTVKS